MKKKIKKYLLLIVFLTLTASLLMSVGIFHHIYREKIIDDMQTYAKLLGGMVTSGAEMQEHYRNIDPDFRVTVIGQDGNVLYETQSDDFTMDNHAGRPEVQTAEERGEAYAIRHSDTMDRDMYYYAVKLENGDILRISKEEGNIWSVFRTAMFGIAGIGVLMFIVCMLLSRYMTDSLVRPIERMAEDIDRVEDVEAYEELIPFITTIQKQHEDILRSARMRQEFTANVSHELKTPLTSISGYSELIETGLAGENEVKRFAGEIHRASRRLLTLINDIIRLSELDSENVGEEFSEVELYSIAAACVETVQVNAKNHGIKIFCHGTPQIVRGSRGTLEELIYNLCDNAIRYNRLGGSVDVTVGQEDGRVFLSVKDTGIGIPKDSQERVFERFYRVDKSRSKQTGGTGLGLAIVKHIVAVYRAELKLESEVGVGTEVKVLFPEKRF